MNCSPVVSRSRRINGFTLVELLVVIAIIAILAAAVLTTGNAVINTAKRAKASNTATQIQTAVLAYYTEYSVYPVVSASTPVDLLYTSQTDWQPMTVCLCGGVDPAVPGTQYATQTISNTRQIAFLTLNAADLDTSGGSSVPAVPKTPFKSSTGGVQYFQMAIDADYSNAVGNSGSGTAPPDFSGALSSVTSTAMSGGKITAAGKIIAGGVGVWANGDPASTATTTNPKLWVHTF